MLPRHAERQLEDLARWYPVVAITGPRQSGKTTLARRAFAALPYVERDVRQLVNARDLAAFRTFVRMCAARSAQPVHLSALAADCGVAANTAKGWLAILQASYVVYTLPQHHANYGKRLIKAPKLYFYDSGLAAWLAGLRSAQELALSSLRGPLFETWAIGEVLKTRSHHRLAPTLHYWRDKLGVEIDLVVDAGTRLLPMEFKAGQTVAGDWVHNLRRYLALAASRASAVPVVEPVVIYGGDAPQIRDGIQIKGWRGLPELALRLLGAQPAAG